MKSFGIGFNDDNEVASENIPGEPWEEEKLLNDPEMCNFFFIEFWRHGNFRDLRSTMNGTNYMVVNYMSFLSIFVFSLLSRL